MSEIVEYKQDYKSFIIKNIRNFTEVALSKYFKHRNYSSFVRQLNLYDFHKIRDQAKEQIYSHINFDINDPKQLKKIKRKKMQSQQLKKLVKRGKKMYKSEQEQQIPQIPQENYQFQEEFHQNSEDQPQENDQNGYQPDNNPRALATQCSIQQLQKKKAQLRRKIQIQQMSNYKLLLQNNYLLNMLYYQNNQFYRQILKILQQLLLSQYQIGQLNKQQYDTMMAYIYYEKEKFLFKELNRSGYNDKGNRKNNITIINHNGNFKIKEINEINENESSSFEMKYSQSRAQQSKLFSLIKQILLNNLREQINIKQFILVLKQYMKRKQHQKNPSNNFLGKRKIRNVMNYCFSIPQMEQSSRFVGRNQVKQCLEMFQKIQQQKQILSSNKSQNKCFIKIQQSVDPVPLAVTRPKKQIKKRKRGRHSSDDEDYHP